MIPKGCFYHYIFLFLLLTIQIYLVESRSLYLRCFQRIQRHSIDNSQPITELFYITPYQCLDQCILITNTANKDGLCRSFVYNHLQHSCRLYSHNGRRSPSIIHPANGYDYFRRTAFTGECAGPLQRFYDARANRNLIPVGAAPNSLKSTKPTKIIKQKPVIETTSPEPPPAKQSLPEPKKIHRDQEEFIIDPNKTITQETDFPKKNKEFKEYVDSEDDYSDFDKSTFKNEVAKASFGKKSSTNQQLDENYDRQNNLQGFQKYQIRPGSTGGLPSGNNAPVFTPNNPADLGYERQTQPRPSPPKYVVRPGSTGGLPGGSPQAVHLPNSASELGYIDETGNFGRKFTPWSTRLPPATPAPPTTPRPPPPPPTRAPEFPRPPPSPPLPPPTKEPEFPRPRPRPPPPPPERPKPIISSRRTCSTSTAYYVVIGNEIILPVTGSENDVKIYHGVEQSKCAQYCSSGIGESGEKIQCQSINYFPLTQKCEIYNILAEPHGPGSLVENDDVIYAEKFCLPSHRGSCQEDEIFILHVQKKLSSSIIKTVSSNSITGCLQACLNNPGCQTSSFDSNRRRCFLHTINIGDEPDAAEETDPGWVLIENGCTSKRKSQRIFGAARPEIDVDIEIDPAYQWSEWSSCRFKIAGKQAVRVRTRKCKERCADGGLEIERC